MQKRSTLMEVIRVKQEHIVHRGSYENFDNLAIIKELVNLDQLFLQYFELEDSF